MDQHLTVSSPGQSEDGEAFSPVLTWHQVAPQPPIGSPSGQFGAERVAGTGGAPAERELTLWPLLHEILEVEPSRLQARPLHEWHRLHQQFFSRLLDLSSLTEAQRQALAIVLRIVNEQTPPLFCKPLNEAQHRTWLAGKRKELAAAGLSDFPPITVQELGALASTYSLRIDYSEPIDITNLPAKALLFFAALYARVSAGIEADERRALLPDQHAVEDGVGGFTEALLTRNRKEAFACFPFFDMSGHSVLEFHRAGLEPVFSSEQLCYILSRNILRRIECRPGAAKREPPHLRLFFHDPITEPITGYSAEFLDVLLLERALPDTRPSHGINDELVCLEANEESVHEFVFDEKESGERRIGALLKLLWLGCAQRTVAGLFWATAKEAARLASVMGRTPEEHFAIERFFALGFRTASANQPWLRPETRFCFKDKVNGPKHWYEAFKGRVAVFQQFGVMEASLLADAEARKELLMTGGNVRSGFQRLNSSEPFRPVAQLFLRPNGKGGWVIHPSDAGAMVRCIDSSISRLIADSGTAIEVTSTFFRSDRQSTVTFWFELSVGIIEAMARLPEIRFAKTDMGDVVAALHQGYKELYGLEIPLAPSLKDIESTTSVEVRQELDRTKRLIWDLALRPLDQLVSGRIEEEIRVLLRMHMAHPSIHKPPLSLSSATDFQLSVRALAQWLRETLAPVEARPLEVDLGRELAGAVTFRQCVEGGQLKAAHARAQSVMPLLSKKKRAEFEQCVSALKVKLAQSVPTPAARPTPLKTAAQAGTAAQLLKVHAEELALPENTLVREFLQLLREDRAAEFRKRKQLLTQLEHLTRFGGREPFRTSRKLLCDQEPVGGGSPA